MEIKKIHSDERRTIYLIENLLKNNKEFTIIKLNKGKAIGGCIHSIAEDFCIIEGFGEFIWKEGHKINSIGYVKGEHSLIPPNTPHMFVAKEDSIIIEWGVPASDKNKYDEKLRKIVDEINKGSDNKNGNII